MTSSPRQRLARARLVVRRAVLRRRRLLAALCAAVAVAAGLQAAAPAAPARVAVTVAATDLTAGEVLGPEDLASVELPPGAAPTGLAPTPAGRTLAAPLRRGEPVTDVRLVAPGLLAGYPGLTALPVRLPDAGVVALLRTGDHVDLVAADPQGSAATTVATGVPVLALPAPGGDDALTSSGAASPPGRLVVVGLEPDDVPQVVDAAARLFLTVAWSR